MGNVGQNTELFLAVPDDSTYYWQVKAIDAGLLSSAWSSEASCIRGDYSADTTSDCVVDLTDLRKLAEHWMDDYR